MERLQSVAVYGDRLQPASDFSPAGGGGAKRACYLVNFQSNDVHMCEQTVVQQANGSPSPAKRQKAAAATAASKQEGEANVISSQVRVTNRAQEAGIQQQQQLFPVHQEDQLNRMRERLFRLLSKVPIQVETIRRDHNQRAPMPGTSCALKTSKARVGEHLRDPLMIKYYQERSLNSIIELHFACSLIGQSAYPTSSADLAGNSRPREAKREKFGQKLAQRSGKFPQATATTVRTRVCLKLACCLKQQNKFKASDHQSNIKQAACQLSRTLMSEMTRVSRAPVWRL